MSDADRKLKIGNDHPYDAPDEWSANWKSTAETPPPAPVDWAHAAARGCVQELEGRGGFDHALSDLDEDLRVEIVQALAAIIRLAKVTYDNPA